MQQQQFLTDCQLLIRDACDATSRHYKTTRLQDSKTASMHRQYQSAPLLGSSDADACIGDNRGNDEDDDDDEQQQHSALHLAKLCKDCCAAALLLSFLCPIINCMAAVKFVVQQDNLCIDHRQMY